jgi:hypothetical protein
LPGDGVEDDLEVAVAPDGLVLVAEVEGVAGEVVVAVDAEPAVARCRRQRQDGRGAVVETRPAGGHRFNPRSI